MELNSGESKSFTISAKPSCSAIMVLNYCHPKPLELKYTIPIMELNFVELIQVTPNHSPEAPNLLVPGLELNQVNIVN